MLRAMIYGILGSLFFSFTFILNRFMELQGGSWLWSASLRFIFMAPILFILLIISKQLRSSVKHLLANWPQYLLWSTIGFGLFYAPLTLASVYSPGWLVAGSWQITIVAGVLLTPLLMKNGYPPQKIPWHNLKWSLLILLGVAFILHDQATAISLAKTLAGLLPIILAAFMYPLGNRKMMIVCKQEINTLQRIFNMTLASLPFWIIISACAVHFHGWPSLSQLEQSFLVALFSGVIATALFFTATQLVHHNAKKLAAIEATQSGEVLFTLLGEMLILHIALPSHLALFGIIMIILGMVFNSLRR